MSVVVSLRDIVSEMAEVGDDHTAYLNRRTGELISLDDEQRYVLDNGHPAGESADGQRELREILESGDLLELPTSFEHHEYSIVERFCDSIRDAAEREELFAAIRGKRAIRDFTAAVSRLGLKDAWVHFRDLAYEEIAIAWLEQNNIAYDNAA